MIMISLLMIMLMIIIKLYCVVLISACRMAIGWLQQLEQRLQ